MFKKILNILTTVLLVSLIALLVAMFIARASGNSLSIFGFRMFRVSSGSMEPTLAVGDVIIVQKTSPEDIHAGDIITYRAEEGIMAGNPITHRVIEEPVQVNGVWVFQTKGDAVGATPDPQIRDSQLMGKYLRTLPIVTKIYAFFLTPYGLITLIAVILVLFGYEMISLIVSYRSFDKVYDQYSQTQDAEAPPSAEPSAEGETGQTLPAHSAPTDDTGQEK